MTTNPDDKKPKQVLATYAVIALIVMFLLNIFVLPGIMERSIRETTYSDFLKGIDSKQIQECPVRRPGFYHLLHPQTGWQNSGLQDRSDQHRQRIDR